VSGATTPARTPALRTKYELQMNVTIREVDERGYAMGQGLEVRHTLNLGAMDFLRISGVLGKFHDLAQSVQEGTEE
jgi:hypothetical protein